MDKFLEYNQAKNQLNENSWRNLNQAPVLYKTLPNVDEFADRGISFTYNVDDYFEDPDGDPLTITPIFISSSPDFASLISITPKSLTFDLTNVVFNQTLFLTGDDGTSYGDFILVSITARNTPPFYSLSCYTVAAETS